MKNKFFYILFLSAILCIAFRCVYAKNSSQDILTADKIKIYADNNTLGDLNKDNIIDSKDATIVLQMASGTVEQDIERADINSDGIIDSKDATLLLMYVSGANKDIWNADTSTEETTELATVTMPYNPTIEGPDPSVEPYFELTTDKDFTYFDFSDLDNGRYSLPYNKGIFTLYPASDGFTVGFDRYDYILLTSTKYHKDIDYIKIDASDYKDGFILKVGGRAEGASPSRIAITDEEGNIVGEQFKLPYYCGAYEDMVFTLSKPGKYRLAAPDMADFKLHQLSIKGI